MYAKVHEGNIMQKSVTCDNHIWKTVLHRIFWQVARFNNIVIELLKMPKDMAVRVHISLNSAVPRPLQSTLLLIST